MAKYIDKDETIRQLQKYADELVYNDNLYDKGRRIGLNRSIITVKAVPAANVQPVKRGKWDFQGYQLFKCTNCKEIFTQNQLEAMQNHIDQEEFTFPNFCPNCGADMREPIE